MAVRVGLSSVEGTHRCPSGRAAMYLSTLRVLDGLMTGQPKMREWVDASVIGAALRQMLVHCPVSACKQASFG